MVLAIREKKVSNTGCLIKETWDLYIESQNQISGPFHHLYVLTRPARLEIQQLAHGFFYLFFFFFLFFIPSRIYNQCPLFYTIQIYSVAAAYKQRLSSIVLELHVSIKERLESGLVFSLEPGFTSSFRASLKRGVIHHACQQSAVPATSYQNPLDSFIVSKLQTVAGRSNNSVGSDSELTSSLPKIHQIMSGLQLLYVYSWQ